MAKVEVYCPKCGENFEAEIAFLAPGEDRFTCDKCDTEFVVKIGFYEVGLSENDLSGL